MRVQIVADIRVLPRPRLERLELRFWLTHVAVEVVELAQLLRLVPRVRIRGVEALMVLHEDEDAMLPRLLEQFQVLGEELRRGLGDEDVDAALDGVEGDGIVRGVRGEDGECGSFGQSVDCGLVGVWVGGGVRRIGREGDVELVVYVGDVLLEMVA